MKILFVSSYFPNATDPVRGTFALQQTCALAKRCEVRVVAPIQWFPVKLWHGAGPTAAPQYEVIEGLPTWHPRYLLTPRVARDTYAAQMALSLIPHISRIRREYPFDVVMAEWAFPDAVAAAMGAKLWGVPLLIKALGSDINVQANYPLRRRQIAWAMKQAHGVFAVSAALRDRIIELGVAEDKVVVQQNGVDRKRFRNTDRSRARRELGISEDGKHVVYVGYLTEAKALHYLIEAVARLKERGALEFTTHLVGCGPLELTLKRLAGERSVTEVLHFHGRRPHTEVPRWMAAADVFCLPSVREGCPNVILEALASGRPVVATRVGGIPELAHEGNSVLVPPSDPEALAAGLKEALARSWEPESLIGSVSRFSWDTTAEMIYEAARSAYSPGPGAASRPLSRRTI